MPDSRELSYSECEAFLRAGVAGRVAMSTPAGPQIVPINYSVVDNAIVLRTTPYSLLGTYGRDTTLAFEIDQFDHANQRGWSVVARGRAIVVHDPADIERIRSVWEPQPVGQRGPHALRPDPLGRADRPPARDRVGPDAGARGAPPGVSVHHTGAVTDDRAALTGPARALLEAVTAISSDLDLRSVLQRIVEAATELTSAQYGALGVVGSDRMLVGVRDHGHRRRDPPPDRRPAAGARDPRPARSRSPLRCACRTWRPTPSPSASPRTTRR